MIFSNPVMNLCFVKWISELLVVKGYIEGYFGMYFLFQVFIKGNLDILRAIRRVRVSLRRIWTAATPPLCSRHRGMGRKDKWSPHCHPLMRWRNPSHTVESCLWMLTWYIDYVMSEKDGWEASAESGGESVFPLVVIGMPEVSQHFNT